MSKVVISERMHSLFKVGLALAVILPVVAGFAAYKAGQNSVILSPSFKPALSELKEPAIKSVGETIHSETEILAILKSMMPGITITQDNIIDLDRVGLYQFLVQGSVFYISKNGSSIIKGDVFDIAMMNHDPDRANLTQEFQRAMSFSLNQFESVEGNVKQRPETLSHDDVRSLLTSLNEKQVVNFKSSELTAKDTFFVFFDLSCPNCKKFMPEVKDLQKAGYDVKLINIAKGGPSSTIYKHTAQLLCQTNPTSELSLYIARGYSGFSKNCDISLDPNYELASRLHIRGTPTIIRASDVKLFEGLHYANELITK